ncbi:MAG TPA: hypothetical protein VFS27_09445 [Blastocatellia bacterium]|nr:hypothetical protein [Blastocatellia bacterium]
MRFLRPTAVVAALLIIAVSIPPSLFSRQAPKPSQPKLPAPRRLQTKRSQRPDALAPAINKLLKLDPLGPEWLAKKALENAETSPVAEGEPPADDAPIEELAAYWSERRDATAPEPSDKVRRRLLEACEDRPELTLGLVDLLPDGADTHDRLYKLLEKEEQYDLGSWQYSLRSWLGRNSRYFRDDLDDLIKEAGGGGVPPADGREARRRLKRLRHLARLDWEAARPLVEALASDGNAEASTAALVMLYERAQKDGDSAQAGMRRAMLKAIVVHRQTPKGARQDALMSLAGADWNGQEEWIVSLFVDPALGGSKEEAREGAGESKDNSGEKSETAGTAANIEELSDILSSLSLTPDREKWYPAINNLVGHKRHEVHRVAVNCLVSFMVDEKYEMEIAQKLAPWMTDPNWAGVYGRADFIESLDSMGDAAYVDIDGVERPGFIKSLDAAQSPELFSGWIWILEHEADIEDEPEYEILDNRLKAMKALARYGDQRAIPALRRELEKEKNEYLRGYIFRALARCGGFSDGEMAEAIEAYSKVDVIVANMAEQDRQNFFYDAEKQRPLEVSVGFALSVKENYGHHVVELERFQGAEGLAVRLIERANALRASQPAVARQILRIVEDFPLRAVEVNLVERIGAGWADIDELKLALENCDSIRKSAKDELYGLLKQGGYAAGVAAAILNDEREQREALAGTDTKAQRALLAGARYLRRKLPVGLVGRLLDSPNRALARAAESYLVIEDGDEARGLVLARRRGKIYRGSRTIRTKSAGF